jgi:hypothetical protein
MNDGTYFYGNEIQASTTVNASSSRTITLTMKPETYWQPSTEMTTQVDVYIIKKEMPSEIGFEYSLSNNFTNSTIRIITDYNTSPIKSFYQEVINGITPSTTYCFRAYAKYMDGNITNGGTSTGVYTTSNF